jgi:hypothetical protein
MKAAYVVFSILLLLSPLLGPNIILSSLFSSSRNLRYSLLAKDHVTNPYKTRGNITVLFLIPVILAVLKSSRSNLWEP